MENNANNRLCGMLGFAMRAGKVIIGTEIVCAMMAKNGSKRPRIVLISRTASEGTKKKVLRKCEFYRIRAIEIDLDGESLGRLLGKLYAPAVVAIVDDRFAEEISRASGADDSTVEK